MFLLCLLCCYENAELKQNILLYYFIPQFSDLMTPFLDHLIQAVFPLLLNANDVSSLGNDKLLVKDAIMLRILCNASGHIVTAALFLINTWLKPSRLACWGKWGGCYLFWPICLLVAMTIWECMGRRKLQIFLCRHVGAMRNGYQISRAQILRQKDRVALLSAPLHILMNLICSALKAGHQRSLSHRPQPQRELQGEANK